MKHAIQIAAAGLNLAFIGGIAVYYGKALTPNNRLVLWIAGCISMGTCMVLVVLRAAGYIVLL